MPRKGARDVRGFARFAAGFQRSLPQRSVKVAGGGAGVRPAWTIRQGEDCRSGEIGSAPRGAPERRFFETILFGLALFVMRIRCLCSRPLSGLSGSALAILARSSGGLPPGERGARPPPTSSPATRLQLTDSRRLPGPARGPSPAGEGAVSSAGLYSAPNVAPSSSAAVTVTCTRRDRPTGSARLLVAAGFLGAAAGVRLDAGTEDTTSSPNEHEPRRHPGPRFYAGLDRFGELGPFGISQRRSRHLRASSDNGKTFTGPSVYTTGRARVRHPRRRLPATRASSTSSISRRTLPPGGRPGGNAASRREHGRRQDVPDRVRTGRR